MTALFEADKVGVSFGGVHALSDVDLAVAEGQLVGLIGPNGAGKTTFIDAATGFVPCQGSFRFDGADLGRTRPHARARRGLARTWQSIELFDALTVRENLMVAAHRPSFWGTVRELVRGSPAQSEAADRALALLDLEPVADDMPDALPQGQRKLVGVGRALAAGARLLCLDEPAAGLDTDESARLGERLQQVVAAGTSILLVDHDMGLVLSICDHVVVLEFGCVIASGPPQQLRADPRVVTAYLGSSAEDAGGSVTVRESA